MCELLGMVASQPADVVFSFTGLALRGGKTGPHADGWGLALYDGKFARVFARNKGVNYIFRKFFEQIFKIFALSSPAEYQNCISCHTFGTF